MASLPSAREDSLSLGQAIGHPPLDIVLEFQLSGASRSFLFRSALERIVRRIGTSRLHQRRERSRFSRIFPGQVDCLGRILFKVVALHRPEALLPDVQSHRFPASFADGFECAVYAFVVPSAHGLEQAFGDFGILALVVGLFHPVFKGDLIPFTWAEVGSGSPPEALTAQSRSDSSAR